MKNLFTQASIDFKTIKEIGKGGQSSVYKAHDRQLNSIIAIKKIPVNSIQKESLFFEEARKIYLSKHQNIVPVYYGCKDDESIYIAMPLYRQGSLKSKIDSSFLTSREIIRYSLQFLSGLNHIHVKGLLHFDVKPENILIADSGQAVLSDFGLASHMGRYGFSKVDGTTEILAPPEFFVQAGHNLKFDVYQAGLTIYRMCNGDKIFIDQYHGATRNGSADPRSNFISTLQSGAFPDRGQYFEHIPRKMRKVVNKSLSIDPDDRYDSSLDLMNDLASIDNSGDWKFSTDYRSNQRWTKPDYEVECVMGGGKWNVSAKKNGRRNRNYCAQGITVGAKKSLVYRCLTNDW